MSSHIYADNGTYTVRAAVTDDDGGEGFQTFQIVVNNVAPTLWIAGNQSVDAGEQLNVVDIGVFTDPGFANPLNTGGEVDETFTYSINWGDGTAPSTGQATIDQLGREGLPTAGSFDGNHTYATPGTYVVTVRVTDDDTGYDEQQFEVLVNDVGSLMSLADGGDAGEGLFTAFDASAPQMMMAVAPMFAFSMAPAAEATNQPPTLVLWGPGNLTVDEGWQDYIDLGTFNDPDSTGPFTYQIDWGDGSPIDSGTATVDLAGPPTAGSFDGRHAYSGGGDHIIGLTIADNDGASAHEDFEITVNNLPPTASIGGAPNRAPRDKRSRFKRT